MTAKVIGQSFPDALILGLTQVFRPSRVQGELMDRKPSQSDYDPVPIALERLYDVHEVAVQCKVSPKSLHKWAREGRIPAVKFGRLWRFRKSAIDDDLNRQAAS